MAEKTPKNPKGAGPKEKYIEPLVTVSFRVPKSLKPIIVDMVRGMVKPYLKPEYREKKINEK